LRKNAAFVGEVPVLIRWQIRFVVDRIHTANGFAHTAIHALLGVDVKRPSSFTNAVNGALSNAGFVLHVGARRADHISHGRSVLATHWRTLEQKSHFQWD
jgi:hypothetical protein